jgi:hypothetical protein
MRPTTAQTGLVACPSHNIAKDVDNGTAATCTMLLQEHAYILEGVLPTPADVLALPNTTFPRGLLLRLSQDICAVPAPAPAGCCASSGGGGAVAGALCASWAGAGTETAECYQYGLFEFEVPPLCPLLCSLCAKLCPLRSEGGCDCCHCYSKVQ